MNNANSLKQLSALQKAILQILPEANGQPDRSETISALRPTDLIEALGKPKDNCSRASISRALSRLHRRGLIQTFEVSHPVAEARWHRYARGSAAVVIEQGQVN